MKVKNLKSSYAILESELGFNEIEKNVNRFLKINGNSELNKKYCKLSFPRKLEEIIKILLDIRFCIKNIEDKD